MHNKGHEIYSVLFVTELHKGDEGVVPTASLIHVIPQFLPQHTMTVVGGILQIRNVVETNKPRLPFHWFVEEGLERNVG